MRRNLILASLFAFPFLAGPAVAQERGFSLGVVGGINIPSTDISTKTPSVGSPSESNGFAGGIHMEGRLTTNLTLASEVLWVRRQADVVFAATDGHPQNTTTYTLDMLEVPYHLKYSFGTGKAVQPYIFGGGSVGFRLSANEDSVATGRPSVSASASDSFESVNWALEAGVGLWAKVAQGTFLLVDGRYVYGLGNFAKQDGDTWKTRDVRVMAGILFALKK